MSSRDPATGQAAWKSYSFKCRKLPVHHCDERVVADLIAAQQPVVVTGTGLVSPALSWDIEYLARNMGDSAYTVYRATDGSSKFKYFDAKKSVDGFVAPMEQLKMTFGEFRDFVVKKPSDSRLYLQEPLTDKVGGKIVEDFLRFNWKWAKNLQVSNGWVALTTNLLLVAQGGNVTPCHYDEQENLFAQAVGQKRVLLFPPESFGCLYPHPVYHPHDRQSQVDFDNPDFEKFPKFAEVEGHEAILRPGDVLYLPSYWFHHFETLPTEQYSVSLTFWYKSAPVGTITRPLKPVQKMAMMRNVEKMINEALGDYTEVEPFWRTLVEGRFVPAATPAPSFSFSSSSSSSSDTPSH